MKPAPGPVVIKKMMSPCLIWQGLWAAAQERRFFLRVRYTKEGTRVHFLNTGGLVVYSMKKNRGRRKIFITRANATSWLSTCWAPSQSLLTPLLWGEIALWLWVQGRNAAWGHDLDHALTLISVTLIVLSSTMSSSISRLSASACLPVVSTSTQETRPLVFYDHHVHTTVNSEFVSHLSSVTQWHLRRKPDLLCSMFTIR